jgi:hypothetical protein
MIEKALMILIFMYAVSFSMLAGQYFIGDVLGITLKNWQGVEIKSAILEFINQDTVNDVTNNIANINTTRNSTLDAVTQSFELGLNIGFELIQLLTGTYIFNLLYLLLGTGSELFIAGLVTIYAILLGRALIAYLRGV